MNREIKHYRNLTNGLFCPCFTTNFSVVRIESTACEQKLWDKIIFTVGADFFYNLAIDNAVIVHDKSERERETRACWQGLSWLRYACHRAWIDDVPPRELSRGGMNINPYWAEQWKLLDRRAKRTLDYYAKYRKSLEGLHTQIYLRSCWQRQHKIRQQAGFIRQQEQRTTCHL